MTISTKDLLQHWHSHAVNTKDPSCKPHEITRIILEFLRHPSQTFLTLNSVGTEIPNFFYTRSFERLCSISLSRNNLATIPSSLASLPSLSAIDLSNNQISFIPPYFFEQWTALHKLDLSRNQISFISNHVSHLTNIRFLDLSYPKFRKINNFNLIFVFITH